MTTVSRQSDTVTAFSNLIDQWTRLNLDLLESMSASSISVMNRMLSMPTTGNLVPTLKSLAAPLAGSQCKIPPPCLMPQSIGEVTCHTCAGGTATVRLHVTNCGATPRDFRFEATGKTPGVTVAPANMALGPMEQDFVAASVAVPANAAMGQEYEILLWVHGCQDHYLRWMVKVASRGASCCHEVEVEDCPDPIHHWYDHFYCERPCAH
jgi:hypothetical protein